MSNKIHERSGLRPAQKPNEQQGSLEPKPQNQTNGEGRSPRKREFDKAKPEPDPLQMSLKEQVERFGTPIIHW